MPKTDNTEKKLLAARHKCPKCGKKGTLRSFVLCSTEDGKNHQWRCPACDTLVAESFDTVITEGRARTLAPGDMVGIRK